MSIDIKKASPADLKKFVDAAKPSTSAKAAILKAKASASGMDKDAKLLVELSKKNPEV